jgi:hypothetical protein
VLFDHRGDGAFGGGADDSGTERFLEAVYTAKAAYARQNREHFQPWERELGDGSGPEQGG